MTFDQFKANAEMTTALRSWVGSEFGRIVLSVLREKGRERIGSMVLNADAIASVRALASIEGYHCAINDLEDLAGFIPAREALTESWGIGPEETDHA